MLTPEQTKQLLDLWYEFDVVKFSTAEDALRRGSFRRLNRDAIESKQWGSVSEVLLWWFEDKFNALR